MNDKQKSILKRFLLFILLFAIVCLIGISNIFALETKTIYSVNNNGTLASANTYNYGYLTGGGTQGSSRANVNTTISGVAYGFMFLYYEPIALNKTYTMIINFMDIDLLKTFNSSMVRVATCNGDICNYNTIVSVVKSNNNGNSNKLTIQFNPITTGSVVLVNLSGNNTAITGVSTFGIKSVTLDSSNPNQDIIDNNTQNSNNIINNQNSNTQDIINNQNDNAQAIINAQYTCKTRSITLNKYIEYPNSFLSSSGSVLGNSQNFSVTSIIKIQKNSNYTINLNYSTSNRYCLYDSELNLISCPSYNNETEISFNSNNAEYIQFAIRSTGTATTFYGGIICLKDSQEQTNAINDLNDTLTDDSPIDMNSLGNVAGWLPPGPIDSIINLPLSMLNSLYSAMQGTCQPLHIPIPYLTNKYLDIPCLSTIFNQIEGLPTFWTWVGLITSTLMLYRYLLALYKYYDDLTTLQANFISDFGGAP